MMATRYLVGCTECPFTGRYSSQAMADAAYNRHSCARHLARAAESTQYLQKMAAIDRTPKPCLHKNARHQHGERNTYILDRCRCLPCATAASRYEEERIRQHAYGRWNGLVDAGPARAHVRELMAQGMGIKRIAVVSGVSTGVLWKLLYGKRKRLKSGGVSKRRTPSRRIQPATEARLLAVQVDLAGGAKVDSAGAVRCLQSLVALGWSMSKLAIRLGILPGNFTPIVHGLRSITVAHDKAVQALYGELSMKRPPEATHRDKIAAARSRRYARERGWLPPLAWDDDPSLVPVDAGDDVDQVAIYRRMHGDKSVKLTRAECAELVRLMVAAGTPKNEIERRTGINPRRESSTPQGVSA